MAEWQPIEAAPKDGREVILREGDRVGAACWIEWPDTHDSDGAPNADGGEGWTIGWDGDEWREPDAWQPLPPARGVPECRPDLTHCPRCNNNNDRCPAGVPGTGGDHA